MGSGFPFSGKLQRFEMGVKGHKPEISRQNMAKTDSFFIRGTIQASTSLQKSEIDLGAFVDPLGKSVMRLLNIAFKVSDAGGIEQPFDLDANTSWMLGYQITTQDPGSTLRGLEDKTVVSSGSVSAANASTVDGNLNYLSHDLDVAPQHFTNGYLIGVPAMWLSAQYDATPKSGAVDVSFIAECIVEKLTTEAAVALALSQQ